MKCKEMRRISQPAYDLPVSSIEDRLLDPFGPVGVLHDQELVLRRLTSHIYIGVRLKSEAVRQNSFFKF